MGLMNHFSIFRNPSDAHNVDENGEQFQET